MTLYDAPNPDAIAPSVEPTPDAVGPYEAASYLDVPVDEWLRVIRDHTVPTVPNQDSYVSRSVLRTFKSARDAARAEALAELAETGHCHGPDLMSVAPELDDGDGDWARALVAVASATAYRAGWRSGFGAGVGTCGIVAALVVILATWLRGNQ